MSNCFTPRIAEILDYYRGQNPGVLTNLARLLTHGRLGGTGKLVILPVDQGFEHGPARSFGPNPAAYDPRYHVQLAIEAGCNAYAAPARLHRSDRRRVRRPDPADPEAQQPRCPPGREGSARGDDLVGNGRAPARLRGRRLHDLPRHGRAAPAVPGAVGDRGRGHATSGLAVVVWAYPRGGGLSKEGETGLDVTAYAAQIAAQLGAHIIKVKLPSAHLEQAAAAKVYESTKIPRDTLAERVEHVVKSSFNGRRIVIFSGGAMNTDRDALLDEARAIQAGGGFGSIMGRNVFQRPRDEAIKLLNDVMSIYEGK